MGILDWIKKTVKTLTTPLKRKEEPPKKEPELQKDIEEIEKTPTTEKKKPKKDKITKEIKGTEERQYWRITKAKIGCQHDWKAITNEKKD